MFKKIDFSSYSTILFTALIFRLVAAIFSAGYGMHDDHFLTIEASSSWAAGFDYNNWLPWSAGNHGYPEGHSFTYVGLNYIFFAVFKFLGITDPKTLMLINRLIHALFSMLIVVFGIKITEKISNKKNAVTVGWLLALLWVMPFLSVRNLVEMTCIPFILWGVWLAVSERYKWTFLYAGLLLGLAVSFRYQVGVFAIGMAAFYFFKHEWKKFFQFCIGVVVIFVLTQGVVDFLIWGYPFAEFLGYVLYNMDEGPQYMPNTNYFMYFYVVFGVLLVPLGLLVAIGFFRSPAKQWTVIIPAAIMLLLHVFIPGLQIIWIGIIGMLLIALGLMGQFKQMNSKWLLYLPTIFFILFHTFYPNRQERFVLSVLPLVIILGVTGFQTLRQTAFWDKTWNVSLKIFWIINIPLLLFATFTSSKISRVNAMYALKDEKIDGKTILLEASGASSTSLMPKFYSGQWYVSFVSREEATDPLVTEGYEFAYIMFFGRDDMSTRVGTYKKIYPNMKLLKKCEPSLMDKILFNLNPNNSNQYIEVWKTNI